MSRTSRILCIWAAAFCLVCSALTTEIRAQLELGGSEWQVAGGGYYYMGSSPTYVSSNGLGVSMGGTYGAPTDQILGQRWHFGDPAQVLYSSLFNGRYQSFFYNDMNDLGGVVGQFNAYDTAGNYQGTRAGYWGVNSGVVALASTNTTNNLFFDTATSINNSGTIVGRSDDRNNNVHAVKWNTPTAAPTILGNLGVDTLGNSFSEARDINQAGAVTGNSYKFSGAGDYLGLMAVRWDAGQTSPTELEAVSFGAAPTQNEGIVINNANQVAGHAVGLDESTFSFSYQVVRWAADGSAQLMENLSVGSSGEFGASVYAMNDRGAIVGTANKFDASGNDLGSRAVRWSANSSAIEELQHLSSYGVDENGRTFSVASGINQAGLAVGAINKYNSSGEWDGSVGALWLPNGTFLDANWLNAVPAEGGNGTWEIQRLDKIASNGWIGGYGIYTENGIELARAFVTQIGLGGIWTNPGLGLSRSWSDGDNWETGTPALQHGSARFANPGDYDISVDSNTLTNFVEVERGNLRLRLLRNRLSSREGMWIGDQANVAMSTEWDANTRTGGQFVGDIVNEGQLSAGQSPGLLSIDGNLFNDGELLFEIGGTEFGEFDQIWLTNHFLAGGVLKVVLTDQFLPGDRDVFDLMKFRTYEKQGMQFDFSLAALPDGWRWNTTQFFRSGFIQARAVPEPAIALVLAASLGVASLAFRRKRHSS